MTLPVASLCSKSMRDRRRRHEGDFATFFSTLLEGSRLGCGWAHLVRVDIPSGGGDKPIPLEINIFGGSMSNCLFTSSDTVHILFCS